MFATTGWFMVLSGECWFEVVWTLVVEGKVPVNATVQKEGGGKRHQVTTYTVWSIYTIPTIFSLVNPTQNITYVNSKH